MVFKKKNKEDLPEYKEQKAELEKTKGEIKVMELGKNTVETELPGKELTPQELVLTMTDNDYRTEVLTLLSEIVTRLRIAEGEKELKK